MRKRVKMSAAADIPRDADILACFGQVVPVQAAVPVRQTCRPYKLGRSENRSLGDCMETRQHLLRGELFKGTEIFMEERETFSRTE